MSQESGWCNLNLIRVAYTGTTDAVLRVYLSFGNGAFSDHSLTVPYLWVIFQRIIAPGSSFPVSSSLRSSIPLALPRPSAEADDKTWRHGCSCRAWHCMALHYCMASSYQTSKSTRLVHPSLYPGAPGCYSFGDADPASCIFSSCHRLSISVCLSACPTSFYCMLF